jgi:hypothetical protein
MASCVLPFLCVSDPKSTLLPYSITSQVPGQREVIPKMCTGFDTEKRTVEVVGKMLTYDIFYNTFYLTHLTMALAFI